MKSSQMKKKIIKYSALMLFLFFYCIAIYVERGEEYVVRLFEGEDLTPVKELEAFIGEDGITITKENKTTYRGSMNIGPNLALEKGRYAFAIKYKTDNPNNYFVIGESKKLNEDGTVGVVYAKKNLSVSENRVRVEFQLEKDINQLEVNVFYEGGELEFYGIDMHIIAGYQDTLLLSVLLIISVGICGFFLYLYKNGVLYKKNGEEIVLLALVVGVTMLPYMNDFLIDGHDLTFHLSRIEGTYRALKYGEFPVRLNPIQSFGYGYASPIMYPQLLIYIPAALRLFGMSLQNSYKILLLIINALTVGIAYFSFYRMFKSRYAALLGAAFYSLCLYRMVNLFVREAVGETIAMAALPLVVYGLYEIIWGEDKKWCFAVIGFTLVLQGHILSTFLYGGTAILFCVFYIVKFIKEKRRIWSLAKAAGMTILLNLWFLIPFLDYMQLPMQLGSVNDFALSDRTAFFSQMFANFVQAGGKNKGTGSTVGEMPLSIGSLLVLGVILFFYLSRDKERIKQSVKLTNLYRAGRIGLLAGGISIYMSSWLFPWEFAEKSKVLMYFIRNIQFLWRLHSISSMALCVVCVAAGCMLIVLYPANAKLVGYGGVVLAICFSAYLVDQTLETPSVGSMAEIANTSECDSLYMYDEQHFEQLLERGESVAVSAGTEAVFTNYQKEGATLSVHAKITKSGTNPYVEVPLYAYPGYQAYWNDVKIPVSVGESGVVRLSIPEEVGEGDIRVYFEEPFYWKIGNLVTVLTVLGTVANGLFDSYGKKKVKMVVTKK